MIVTLPHRGPDRRGSALPHALHPRYYESFGLKAHLRFATRRRCGSDPTSSGIAPSRDCAKHWNQRMESVKPGDGAFYARRSTRCYRLAGSCLAARIPSSSITRHRSDLTSNTSGEDNTLHRPVVIQPRGKRLSERSSPFSLTFLPVRSQFAGARTGARAPDLG